MASRIQLRRGTAAEWTNTTPSPVLAEGELGFETDTGKLKIGDGTTTWTALSYVAIQGVQGTTGPAGSGAQGTTGAQGATGTQGADGLQGIPGPNGTQGTDGAQGADGLQGSTGSTPTITIPGPYDDDLNAGLDGVAIGQLYYQPGGAVFVRLT